MKIQHPAKTQFAKILLACKQNGVRSILEIGAGEPTNMLKIFPDVTVIDTCTKKLGKVNIPNAIKLVMNGNDLSFPDNTFDLVSVESTWDHIPKPKQAFEEFLRVSKRYVLIGNGNNLVSRSLGMYTHGFTSTKTYDWRGHYCHMFYWKVKKFLKDYDVKVVIEKWSGVGLPFIGYKLNSPCPHLSRHYYLLLEKIDT